LKSALIIVNYKTPKMTADLVSSVMDFPVFDKIIIVDNRSLDNSYEKLKYLDGGKVDVLKNSKKGGFGSAVNEGVQYVKDNFYPDFIFLASSDVLFSEECANEMADCLRQRSDAAMVTANMKTPFKKGYTPVAWRLPTTFSEIVSSGLITYKLFRNTRLVHFYSENYVNSQRPYCEVDCAMTAFCCIRTSMFMKAGMFDTDFTFYCEESVLGWKFKEKEYAVLLLTDYHYDRSYGTSLEFNKKSLAKEKRQLFKSNYLYLKKYRNVNKLKLFFVKLFMKLWVVEFWCYSKLDKLRWWKRKG